MHPTCHVSGGHDLTRSQGIVSETKIKIRSSSCKGIEYVHRVTECDKNKLR